MISTLHLPFRRIDGDMLHRLLVLLWILSIIGVFLIDVFYPLKLALHFLVWVFPLIPISISENVILVFKNDVLVKEFAFHDEYTFTLSETVVNFPHNYCHKKRERRIHWSSVLDVKPSVGFRKATLVLKTMDSIQLDYKAGGFFLFLQRLPQLPSFDKEELQSFLTKLETCPVCGIIAKDEDICLSCSVDFSQEAQGEVTDEEFLQEHQLWHFMWDVREDGSVDFYKDLNNGFKRDSFWKPSIDEKSILGFMVRERRF